MDDLAKAIDDHSQYDGADYDKFWETLYEQHAEEYLQTAGKHSLSGFQVWAEDKDLVPDDEVFENA